MWPEKYQYLCLCGNNNNTKTDGSAHLVVWGGQPGDATHVIIEGRAGAGELPAVRGVVLHSPGRVGAPVAWGQGGDHPDGEVHLQHAVGQISFSHVLILF